MEDQETAQETPEQAEQPETAETRQPLPPWPPFQFDYTREFRMCGIAILTGRVALSPESRAHGVPRVWIAAIKGSDRLAGRGGIGTGRKGEERAVEDLLRMLRDRYLPAPQPEGLNRQ